jgi:hypothetical protein
VRAIRVAQNLTIVPLFQKENATQLLPDGSQQVVQITKAILFNGAGLEPIGVGWAICQPEDKFNAGTGTKRALARALKHATMLSKFERNTVFTVLRRALGETQEPASPGLEAYRRDHGPSVTERLARFVQEIQNQGLSSSWDVETLMAKVPVDANQTPAIDWGAQPSWAVSHQHTVDQHPHAEWQERQGYKVQDRRPLGAYADIGRNW